MPDFVRYDESFALIRLLDDPRPDNSARRRKFKAFLKEINALEGSDVRAKTNARFQAMVGGPDLLRLQIEYIQRVKTESVCPWEAYANEIRLLPGSALQAEAFPASSAFAFSTSISGDYPLQLHTSANISSMGSNQADLLFGRTAPDDFYVLAYGKGFLSLLHFNGHYQTLANIVLDPKLFQPGNHLLEADIDSHTVQARLDGKLLVTLGRSTGKFPAGQWGVGAYDSRVIFHDIWVKKPRR